MTPDQRTLLRLAAEALRHHRNDAKGAQIRNELAAALDRIAVEGQEPEKLLQGLVCQQCRSVVRRIVGGLCDDCNTTQEAHHGAG